MSPPEVATIAPARRRRTPRRPRARTVTPSTTSLLAVGCIVREHARSRASPSERSRWAASGTLYAGANLEFPQLPLSAQRPRGAVGGGQRVGARRERDRRAGGDRGAVRALPAVPQRARGQPNGSRIIVAALASGDAGGAAARRVRAGRSGRCRSFARAADHGFAEWASVRRPAVRCTVRRPRWRQLNTSYAPYTRAYAGVALRLRDGASPVVAGRYAECAAYNPSLPALQAALVALALRRTAPADIVDVVLAEAAGPSSQRTTAARPRRCMRFPASRFAVSRSRAQGSVELRMCLECVRGMLGT